MVKSRQLAKSVFTFLLVFVLMLSFVSAAWEFDNVRDYDAANREVTITNAFGLGQEITKISLISPDHVSTSIGYQSVGEYEVNSKEDYNEVFNDMDFMDMKTGLPILRDFDYKIEVKIGEEEIQNYTRVCSRGMDVNGTTRDICNRQLFNTYMKDIVEWQTLDQSNGLVRGVHKISIWTEVQRGDYVDWIPTLYGERIHEWATWQDVGNLGLKSYHTFNESSLPMIDSAPENLHTTSNDDNAPIYGSLGGRNSSYMGLDGAAADGIILHSYNNSDVSMGTNWSVSFWWNSSDGAQHTMGTTQGGNFIMKWNGINDRFDLETPTVSLTSCSVTGMSINVWHHYYATGNATGTFLYADGTLCDSSTTKSNFPPTTTAFFVGCTTFDGSACQSGADGVTGGIDEISIWNRTLTQPEISAIAEGITFGPILPPGLVGSVQLLIPVNNTNITITSQDFSANSTVNNGDITNSTLRVWFINNTLHSEILNLTSGQDLTNTTFFTVTGLIHGTYVWNVFTDFNNGTDTLTNWSLTNNTLNVDLNPPEIVITSPNGTTPYFILGNNETLNTTITDALLDTCWYDYNGVNITIPGCASGVDNIISFLLEVDNYDLTVYANDSGNAISSELTTWEYQVLEKANIFNNPVVGGAIEPFQLDVNTSESITSAILIHNGTSFTTNLLFLGGDAYEITSNIVMPILSSDANVSFNYNITLSGGDVIPTNTSIQEIAILDIADCSTFSNLLFNLSLFDERTLVDINGTIEFDLDILNAGDFSSVFQSSITLDNVHEGLVCSDLNITSGNYVYNLELRYFSSPDNGTTFTHVPEFYHIQRSPISNLPQTILLFDLNINESTEFTIHYKDDSFLPRENVLLQILRRYVGEGLFRTVEIPITSSEGTTVAHFDLNNYKYKIIASQNGVVLNTFNNPSIRCESELSGICEIFLSGATAAQNVDAVSNLKDFFYQVDQTNDSIIVDYAIPSGESTTTVIQMTQTSPFTDPTIICDQTIVSSAGSVECFISPSIGDSAVEITIFSNSINQANLRATFQEDLQAGFLLSNYFIAAMMMMFLILMFASSPQMMMTSAIFGFAYLGFVFLLKSSSVGLVVGAITWLILAVAIILIKMNKKEEQ